MDAAENWPELVQKDLLTETFIYDRLLWTLREDTIEQGDLIDAMIQFFSEKKTPESADLFLRQCNACANHDSTGRLERLAESTLILSGKDDILTLPKLHREINELIPNSRLVILNCGGYRVMVESAKRFNQMVSQFLAEDSP